MGRGAALLGAGKVWCCVPCRAHTVLSGLGLCCPCFAPGAVLSSLCLWKLKLCAAQRRFLSLLPLLLSCGCQRCCLHKKPFLSSSFPGMNVAPVPSGGHPGWL